MSKLNVEDAKNKAISYFKERPLNFPEGRPYNCCESVLKALSEYLGMGSDLIPRIGTVIGAGLSLTGKQCGTLSGAAMAIGMAYGRNSSEESPLKAWSIGRELVAEFEKRYKHTTCRELTGQDLMTPEGMKTYVDRLHDTVCAERVGFVVEKTIEIIEKNRVQTKK
jgi:C_GCAxxG_C_C family probable redox protein